MKMSVIASPKDVVVVTGAASGIGKACVAQLASVGARVAALDIVEQPSTSGSLAVACDLESFSDVESARRLINAELGSVTHVIHSAARFTGTRAIDGYSDEDVARLVHSNVVGSINVLRAFVPDLRQHQGVIVLIGSIAGEIGLWRDSVYAATKSALIGLAKSVAVEEASSGVRINVVLPGNVLTDARARAVLAYPDPEQINDYLDAMSWNRRGSDPNEIALMAMTLLTEDFPSLTGAKVNISAGMELGASPKVLLSDWPVSAGS